MKGAKRDYAELPARTGLVCTMVDEHGNAIPLPPHTAPDVIDVPGGWLFHEDGHGYTVLEMEQHKRESRVIAARSDNG